MPPAVLSLADLEAHDPYSRSNGRERRFSCLYCGGDKKQDAAHRSLAVNSDTGAWVCHRCHEKGLLLEFQTRKTESDRPGGGRRGTNSQRRSAPRRAALPPIQPSPNAETWESTFVINDLHFPAFPLDIPGAHAARAYLTRRGIASDPVAMDAGVRYSPKWQGNRPAVLFPVHDEQGRFMAAQGRYIDGGGMKTTSAGSVGSGVFSTPGALPTKADGRIILTEAPMDALSLHACGYPAVAFCGSGMKPKWVDVRCSFKTVYLAFDADEVGDKAAEEWTKRLMPFTRQVVRLRPDGGKDWNELLMRPGRAWLEDWLDANIAATESAPEPPIRPREAHRSPETGAAAENDLQPAPVPERRCARVPVGPAAWSNIAERLQNEQWPKATDRVNRHKAALLNWLLNAGGTAPYADIAAGLFVLDIVGYSFAAAFLLAVHRGEIEQQIQTEDGGCWGLTAKHF